LGNNNGSQENPTHEDVAESEENATEGENESEENPPETDESEDEEDLDSGLTDPEEERLWEGLCFFVIEIQLLNLHLLK
jgi:hypothetical protein